MIAVLTHFPSPYQVELFNEIDRQYPGCLKVLYLFRRDPTRSWKGVSVTHSHDYVDQPAIQPSIIEAIDEAEFVVFNYFNDSRAAELIRRRDRCERPWCFWGERPGYRYGWLARINRMGRLASLYAGRQPIWGIGSWAVDAYRDEFGDARQYRNLPYFSNLDRFQHLRPSYSDDQFNFLFSGAVTYRKGIDVLARAFVRLCEEAPRARLTIMGKGDLAPGVQRILRARVQVDWIGFKDWEELPAIYAQAHALCVPSRHDGWALVVPEGLASGLPTIGTNRTGAALDLIEPGNNGWVVPAADEDALLEAMREAVALDRREWQTMSDNATASVSTHSLAAGARRFMIAVRESAEAVAAAR